MSEETPKPKQYLVMVDELTMAMLARLIPSLLFVQVEGLAVTGNDNYNLLVTPIPKPAQESVPVEEVPVTDAV